MQTIIFLLLKKLKNTESAQLWFVQVNVSVCACLCVWGLVCLCLCVRCTGRKEIKTPRRIGSAILTRRDYRYMYGAADTSLWDRVIRRHVHWCGWLYTFAADPSADCVYTLYIHIYKHVRYTVSRTDSRRSLINVLYPFIATAHVVCAQLLMLHHAVSKHAFIYRTSIYTSTYKGPLKEHAPS